MWAGLILGSRQELWYPNGTGHRTLICKPTTRIWNFVRDEMDMWYAKCKTSIATGIGQCCDTYQDCKTLSLASMA